jgi:hypothetical protein
VSARLTTAGGAVVAACAVTFLAAAQIAHAAPKPEAPPHQRGTSLQAVPGPGSTSAKTTSTPASSSRGSTHRPTVQPPAGSTQITRYTRTTSSRKPVAPQRRATTRPKSHAPAPEHPLLPVGLRNAAGFGEVRSVASSSDSSWLLAAGLLLVLLVLGETTFLGLAGPRLGLAVPRATRERRRPPEELPIRRIQLRR